MESIILFSVVLLVFGVLIVVVNFTYVEPDEYINAEWRFPFSPTVSGGHFIATGWQQGIRAKIYGPGWHFIFLVGLFGKITRHDLVKIPKGKFAKVFAKDGKRLPVGKVISEKNVECANFTDGDAFLLGGGERGFQLAMVPSGTWTMNEALFDFIFVDSTEVSAVSEKYKDPATGEEKERLRAQMGIINSFIGKEIPEDQKGKRIIAPKPEFLAGDGHQNFQDASAFLRGGGAEGIQEELVFTGKFFINDSAFSVQVVLAPFVPQGFVGVLISNVGDDPTDEEKEYVGEKKGGNAVFILKDEVIDKRGILSKVRGPGDHFLHPVANRLILVDTTPRSVLLDGSRDEFDKVNIVTSDGFTVPMQAELVFKTIPKNAPKVIALARSIEELEEDVIAPFVDDIAKRVASKKAIKELFSGREEIRQEIENALKGELENNFYIEISSFRIIKLDFESSPDAEVRTFANLMARVANAAQEQLTIAAETDVAVKSIELERNKALANRQDIIVTAELRATAAESNKQAIATVSDVLAEFVGKLPNNFPAQIAGILGGEPGNFVGSLASWINSLAKKNEGEGQKKIS